MRSNVLLIHFPEQASHLFTRRALSHLKRDKCERRFFFFYIHRNTYLLNTRVQPDCFGSSDSIMNQQELITWPNAADRELFDVCTPALLFS